jgi:carbon-monoxide dehydrogenase large subunit
MRAMDKFGRSQPVTRFEDVRFLTGTGRYVDDIAPKEAWHAVMLRSPVAHGRITELDLEDARQAPGVKLILTVQDLEAAGISVGMSGTQVKNRDGSQGAGPERPMLARDHVRFVGEPIALIVAETAVQARDALELVMLDFEDLPAKMDVAPGGPALHDDAPDNVAFDWGMGDEAATEAAFAAAAHTVAVEVVDNRIIVNAMEPRGCFADWDGERLHFTYGGQGVWAMKAQLVEKFGLPEEQVHVTTPDVGGGFGMKAMPYPEYFAVAEASRALGHPVRWISDRGEAMLSDNAGRDLVSLAELAFDADHKITGYRVTTTANMGAYNSHFAQAIQTQLFSRVLTGVYDIQTTWLQATGVYTNTTQVDAYRGAGRPEAIFVLERAMDHAARQLGVDPWELRRRNFIRPDAFPYKTATGETYDVGDFDKLVRRVSETADLAGFEARCQQDAAQGLLRGLGTCYYIESILGDPSEGARVVFQEDGRVSIFVGTQSNGQGHETVYAQFLSDQTGIPVDRIDVVQGDSDLIARGGGTGGSRSVTTQANATLAMVDVMIAAFTGFLAEQWDTDPDAITFDGDSFRSPGSNLTPSLTEVADMARAAGQMELLSHEARAQLPGRSYPNGAHVAEIVIDPETGGARVDRYTVVDDFGNLINPLLAEGQVHGGVVQGVGQAMMEHVVHDADGQLLTASFMDYALPRAADTPMIGFTSEPVPSTANPMGMKGCGEAGTVGALAAVANAVQDAVEKRGVHRIDMPFTPHRIWKALRDATVTTG